MRINILINKNKYAIDVDTNCFIPVKFGTNGTTGKETETQLGYFNKLGNAAQRLLREEVATSDSVVSLKEFVAICEANNAQLLKQLEAVPV